MLPSRSQVPQSKAKDPAAQSRFGDGGATVGNCSMNSDRFEEYCRLGEEKARRHGARTLSLQASGGRPSALRRRREINPYRERHVLRVMQVCGAIADYAD
jgi:hypothetical protein